MTVYFDFKVNIRSGHLVNYVQWHNQLPLLAVGTRTLQPLTRTYVTIFDQLVIIVNDYKWRNISRFFFFSSEKLHLNIEARTRIV